jgi:hypothetical protein
MRHKQKKNVFCLCRDLSPKGKFLVRTKLTPNSCFSHTFIIHAYLRLWYTVCNRNSYSQSLPNFFPIFIFKVIVLLLRKQPRMKLSNNSSCYFYQKNDLFIKNVFPDKIVKTWQPLIFAH